MDKKHFLQQIPSIDKILHSEKVGPLIKIYGRPLVTYAARHAVDQLRTRMDKKGERDETNLPVIIEEITRIVESIALPSLKPVINATGIVLHTNLGRAPLGERVLKEISPIIRGYSNLEYDLTNACRGHRGDHVAALLKYLTGAEDVVVVNNNAAALILALHTFAKGKEVIISRGELIEIGGAFRIPEIMAAAGAKMVEVGTTNRTRLSDYEKAIGPKTALIVKAHTSNFSIAGFTEEVSIADLAGFAHQKNLPFLYDIGSGLFRKPQKLNSLEEPVVQTAIASGTDMVTFSCDKLLGGPQAGVVAGKGDLIKRLSKAPLMRALRVGKLSLAALWSVCRAYLEENGPATANPAILFLERSLEERQLLAGRLLDAFGTLGIKARIIESHGQAGGGTLPNLKLKSAAVALDSPSASTAKQRGEFAEKIFAGLLKSERPVLGVLREGILLFDCLAVFDDEISPIAAGVAACMESTVRV